MLLRLGAITAEEARQLEQEVADSEVNVGGPGAQLEKEVELPPDLGHDRNRLHDGRHGIERNDSARQQNQRNIDEKSRTR